MEIVGIDGLSTQQVMEEIQQGARFVVFQYTISILVMTFRRPSAVYYVRPGHSALARGLAYSLLTFVLGWWGFPWGPIYTIGSLVTNFGGGKDVTESMLAAIRA